MPTQQLLTGTVLIFLLGAGVGAPQTPVPTVLVQVFSQTLNLAQCGNGFAAHDLPHISQGRQQPAQGFDGNGSGVALGDFNNDGLIDMVLADLNGPASVLWNQGGFKFRKTTIDNLSTRAAAVVDVDADGWADITFTHNLGTPSYWRNLKNGQFADTDLPGVNVRAYTFLWDDLGGDGKLDLVTASYDAILEAELKNGFLFSNGAGIMLYRPGPNGYSAQRLAEKAQAMGITTFDTNNDGIAELIVGNDFDLPDMIWDQNSWTKLPTFPKFTQHTMGFASGDFNNDGSPELFATDMKPDFRDLKALAPWIPLMQKGFNRLVHSSPQRPENMLYMRGAKGYQNQAYQLGLDATGWSWSAKFGDLDNDGYEELYVVNGMIDAELFKYLPGGELVEKNQLFYNQAGRRFLRKPEWNLGSTRSGRGMSMADLDNDGDLDIVVNNLSSPSQMFENRNCGRSVQVELRWEGTQNLNAIGAQVLVKGQTQQWRKVTATSGYLSGDAPRVHFGLGNQEARSLEVIWPDGKRSLINNPKAGRLLTVVRK